MLRGLFEGAQYNSEAGAKCAVYSRARSNQGNTVIASLISSFLVVCKLIISMSDIVLLRTSSACVNFLDRIQNVESRQKPAWLLDFSCGSTAKYFSDCNVVRPVGYGRCRRSGDILKSVRVHFAYGRIALMLELLGRFGRFLDEDDRCNHPVLLIPFRRLLGL